MSRDPRDVDLLGRVLTRSQLAEYDARRLKGTPT